MYLATDGTVERAHSPVSRRLNNGMDVLIIPDRRGPIVTHMIWYRNGAAEDPSGKSGIAHFLEHLMFKGTATNPAGRFSEAVESVGGRENAFTSRDYTAYFQRVPSEHLATCMAFEADRMRNLVLDDATVDPERQVVLEERQMRVDGDPASILDEAVQAAAFTSHPYGKPIIGWQHEIDALGRADALAYYRHFYTPDNAILVVAGDVEPEAAINLAERIYGPISGSAEPPVRARAQEPAPRTHRQIHLSDAKVRQPSLLRRHVVPSRRTGPAGEAEVFDLLTVLLGGPQTGRFDRELVRARQVATSIQVSYWGTCVDEACFDIRGWPAADETPETLDAAVQELLDRLIVDGFEAGEIARAKTQLVAEATYARDNQDSLAQWYGASLACGLSIEQVDTWDERVERVTREDLMRAMRRLDRRFGVSGYLVAGEA